MPHFIYVTTLYVYILLYSKIVLLSSRACLYFQNLVTADVRTLKANEDALFAAFLNQKGRFIADAFLFGRATAATDPAATIPATASKQPDSSASAVDCILIDCAASAAPVLLTHLKQFKLRARLTIDDVSNECVDTRFQK